MAMLASYYGKDTDPDRLNQALIAVGGYKNTNLYKWYEGVPKMFPDIVCKQVVSTKDHPVTPAEFAVIDEQLRKGFPVVTEVDFIPNTAKADMHFVVIIGKEGDNYKVADPWYGDLADLTRYGKPAITIQRFVIHEGPVQLAENTALKLQEAFEHTKRSLADTVRLWNDDVEAKKRAEKARDEWKTAYEGERSARKGWEEWFTSVWAILNPVGKEKNPQNALGEITELLQREDQLTQKTKDTEKAEDKYEELFAKVSQIVDYSGNDTEGLYKRIGEVLSSKDAAKLPISTEDAVERILMPTRGGLIKRFIRYFTKNYFL